MEEDKWNALHLACQFYGRDNLISLVKLLIDKVEDVNYRGTATGETPSTFISYSNANLIDIIKLLIEKDIDIHCKDKDGWNAFLIVCRTYSKRNLIDMVQLFVRHKADVSAAKTVTETTLLMACV